MKEAPHPAATPPPKAPGAVGDRALLSTERPSRKFLAGTGVAADQVAIAVATAAAELSKAAAVIAAAARRRRAARAWSLSRSDWCSSESRRA